MLSCVNSAYLSYYKCDDMKLRHLWSLESEHNPFDYDHKNLRAS